MPHNFKKVDTTVTQTVSPRSLTAETRVRARLIHFVVRDRHIGTVAGF